MAEENADDVAADGEGQQGAALDGEGQQEEQSQLELATKAAERLDAKMKALEEKEKQIDKKIKDFTNFVKATEAGGSLPAGDKKKKEETPKEYAARVMRNEL